MIERINYQDLPQAAGPYVHATKHNNTLYISGLTAYETEVQSSSLIAQTTEILSQLSIILDCEGLVKNNLVKLTIFVRDIGSLTSIRELLFQFYEESLPACSLVEVSKLTHPDLLVEIEAIAAL